MKGYTNHVQIVRVRRPTKNRRRARKLADEAWEAADAGNLDLAEKIIRRAVDAQPDNPVLWNDQGVILGMRQDQSDYRMDLVWTTR